MCTLFVATYPERTDALVLYGGMALFERARPTIPGPEPRDALLGMVCNPSCGIDAGEDYLLRANFLVRRRRPA